MVVVEMGVEHRVDVLGGKSLPLQRLQHKAGAALRRAAAPGLAVHNVVLVNAGVHHNVLPAVLQQIACVGEVHGQLRVQPRRQGALFHRDLAVVQRFDGPVIHIVPPLQVGQGPACPYAAYILLQVSCHLPRPAKPAPPKTLRLRPPFSPFFRLYHFLYAIPAVPRAQSVSTLYQNRNVLFSIHHFGSKIV